MQSIYIVWSMESNLFPSTTTGHGKTPTSAAREFEFSKVTCRTDVQKLLASCRTEITTNMIFHQQLKLIWQIK